MSTEFYQNIKGFHQFSQLTDPTHYVPVPDDWIVVITDIENSTQAIASGHYKEVNLAGAAVIIAILNIAKDVSIPYAFGGDGATILIPPHLLKDARTTLAAVQHKIKVVFDLDLRAGCVPLSVLYQQGSWLKLAKFHLSPTVSQATFQGTALGMAEHWLKHGSKNITRIEGYSQTDGNPNLSGLECRWEPIQSRSGLMLSLLVHVMPEHEAEAWSIYSSVLEQIAVIYPESESAPVQPARMRLSFAPANLSKEAKIRAGQNPIAYLLYLARIYFINAIGAFAFQSRKPVGSFDGQRYLSELAANTDARKFDEMIRMVLDSTPEQKEALERMLSKRQLRGEIAYGIHTSSQALMTCLVFNLSGNHIHFVDGADGGYAMAAKQMKQQLAKAL